MAAHTPPRPASALPSATQALADALAASEPLARLTERLRQSRARFSLIEPLLPPAMRAAVQPGPIDEASFCLLATSSAVAAKLRQLAPQLQAALAAQGLGEPPIRVKLRVDAADVRPRPARRA